MGCTGPIVMVNDSKLKNAINILSKEGYELEDSNIC